jgi:hypothetical protein
MISPHLTHVSDQMQAASAEARAILEGPIAGTFPESQISMMVTPTPWLARRVNDHIEAGTCGHLRGPMPTYIVCFLTPLLRCSLCAQVATEALQGVEDHVCDVCRQPVDQICMFAIQAGPMLIMGGTCLDCHPAVSTETTHDQLGQPG